MAADCAMRELPAEGCVFMRFIIYKNSVLATICSLFGSAFIAMAVMALFNQELDIPTGIIVIAIGAALFWLGSFISARKERKK